MVRSEVVAAPGPDVSLSEVTAGGAARPPLPTRGSTWSTLGPAPSWETQVRGCHFQLTLTITPAEERLRSDAGTRMASALNRRGRRRDVAVKDKSHQSLAWRQAPPRDDCQACVERLPAQVRAGSPALINRRG